MTTRHVGSPTRRIEDAPLITGAARWVDDHKPPGTVFLAVVRSPIAHGRIVAIDLDEARRRDDVVAAYTGADVRDWWVSPPPIIAPRDGYTTVQWPLSVDVVRYVGEPIAVLLVTDRAAVEDALEAVVVDLEPLPVVATVAAALAGPTMVHPEAGSNVAFTVDGTPVGDVDELFATADVVVRRTFAHQRVHATAMEPRAVLAEPHEDGTMTVFASTQVPHRLRDTVAAVIGIDAADVRVRAEHVGGGFGPKLEVYAEDYLCAALARVHGVPVRFTATRSEDFVTTVHGRGQTQDVEAAATADGRLLALRVRSTGDVGAYLSRSGTIQPVNGGKVSPGAYRWEAFDYTVRGVFTNRTPVGAYRGAGRPEAAFAVERIVDEIAVALDIDPAELRRRNFPRPDEFPFASVSGYNYDSGDYAGALDRALALVDYPRRRAEQRRRREAGEARLLGIGIASYIDRCGTGPGLGEFAGAELATDGRIVLRTGLGPTGQGTATSLAQIAADCFAVAIDAVEVHAGDTDDVASGAGTFGSRSMAVGGVAVHRAAIELAAQVRSAAAELLEVADEDLEFRDGACVVRGAPTVSITLADIARRTGAALAAAVSHDPEQLTFPYGTYVAVVEVDTDTGRVEVINIAAVDDAGTIINPALFAGQIQGGIAQGVGQVLFENAAYDDEGNPIAGTLFDYLVPTAPDVPAFTLAQTQTPADNLLGVKGVGESGTIGAPPAIVNAVIDALRGLGVTEVALPCTPHTVWRAIQEARR